MRLVKSNAKSLFGLKTQKILNYRLVSEDILYDINLDGITE